MQTIFKEVMDGVTLPKPWQPTSMKSYAKGRAPFRIWAKRVTNREAERDRAAKERAAHKKVDTILRAIAKKSGCTLREVRAYAIEHAAEIFS